MDIDQSSRDISQLDELFNRDQVKAEATRKPTNSNRFTPGFASTNSLMLPLGIQSEIIANWPSDIVTPISGKTLGCRRVLHVTTSLQNFYMGTGRRWGLQGEKKINNSRRVSSASHCFYTSSRPSQQPPGRNISPSTRQRTRPYTARHRFDRSNRGSSWFSEEARRGRTSCTAVGGIAFWPMAKVQTLPMPS